MRERVVTLLCAIGALLLFYAFFIGNRAPDAQKVTRPISTEAGPNGYLALRRWLAAQGIEVVPLLRRYDSLMPYDADWSTGNVLLTTLPHERPARWNESIGLKNWVRAGNTVVVAAGVLDTPEWSFEGEPPYAGGLDVLNTLQQLAGLTMKACAQAPDGTPGPNAAPPPAAGTNPPPHAPFAVQLIEPLPAPKRSILQPNGTHPYLDGVQEVATLSEYEADRLCIATVPTVALLSLMHDGTPLPALWARKLGAGWIIVSAYGSVFTNKLLGEADNARLFANILRMHLGSHGIVYLDDLHQGARSVYDAASFYGDPRLHVTFWWIIGLWLVYVLGSTRLHGATATAEPLDESRLTVAIGHLLARKLGDRRAARRLFQHFFDEMKELRGTPDTGTSVWDWLRQTTRIAPAAIARLERMHAALGRRGRIDLVELQNALCALRRELS